MANKIKSVGNTVTFQNENLKEIFDQLAVLRKEGVKASCKFSGTCIDLTLDFTGLAAGYEPICSGIELDLLSDSYELDALTQDFVNASNKALAEAKAINEATTEAKAFAESVNSAK